MVPAVYLNFCEIISSDIFSLHFLAIRQSVDVTPSIFSLKECVFLIKGCVRYIFARLFLGLTESPCQTGKNIFYFTSKVIFVLEKIKF